MVLSVEETSRREREGEEAPFRGEYWGRTTCINLTQRELSWPTSALENPETEEARVGRGENLGEKCLPKLEEVSAKEGAGSEAGVGNGRIIRLGLIFWDLNILFFRIFQWNDSQKKRQHSAIFDQVGKIKVWGYGESETRRRRNARFDEQIFLGFVDIDLEFKFVTRREGNRKEGPWVMGVRREREGFLDLRIKYQGFFDVVDLDLWPGWRKIERCLDEWWERDEEEKGSLIEWSNREVILQICSHSCGIMIRVTDIKSIMRND
jgi:hypothetical protein